MKKITFFTSILFAMCVSCIYASDPATVQEVDLSKYLGKWHEIARLPNAFEAADAQEITATYSLNSDNTLRVENSCYVNGKLEKVVGVARIEDPKSKAKLGVSFFDILGFRPIWGDYWILGLGPNYSYSVVGDRARKYAWILSRTPALGEKEMDEAITILKNNGFDVTRLLIVSKNK